MLVEKSFIDIENAVEDALEIDCEFGVSFITKYDNAIVVLKELLRYGETMPFFIDISDPSWDGYDKEFVISINNDDEVFCEKFCRDGKYLSPDDGVVFILPDCSDECLTHLYKYEDCFFVKANIDDDIEPCNCCQNDDVYERVMKDEDGNVVAYARISKSGDLCCSVISILND